jgi:hypothetical protein
MAERVSPWTTVWTLLKLAVWRLTSRVSRPGSTYSLKVTVTFARAGRPSSRKRRNFWPARASTQRNWSEAQATLMMGGACSSGSMSRRRTIFWVSTRTSLLRS